MRNSHVKSVDIKSILFSSVLEIGDSVYTNACNRAISVKREQELYRGNELKFSNYPIFSEPIPIPPLVFPPPLIRKYNENPNIYVKRIGIKGVSNSAIVQIGNSEYITLESRVFHSRQLRGLVNR